MSDHTDSTDPDISSITVVTHPLGGAGENATRTLLDILSSITTVSLITADLPEDSTIRRNYSVNEISTQEAAQSTVPTAIVRFLRNQIRMCRALRRNDGEIILFFGATAYLLPIVWAKLLGKTVILEPRGDVPLTLKLQWEQRYPTTAARILAATVRTIEYVGYWAADAIITYTPSMAEELNLSRFAGKVYPNGARYVDTERFHPQRPWNERNRIVGFLGRLDEEKGIRALATVAKELPEDITFRFIGDGPLRDWLENKLNEEINKGEVEITGWIDHDDVPQELSKLQLLVMPSAPTEGLPTVILEAMACGTPVFATPVSGIPDVVQDKKTGFLIEDRDASVIATEIENIVDNEPLPEIGEAAQRVANNVYSHTHAIKRYQLMLTEINTTEN